MALQYIPTYLPDQTISRVIEGYRSNTLLSSPKVIKRLFAKKDTPAIDLPIGLDVFSERTSLFYGMNSIEMIQKMTLWPYYSHFIKRENHHEIIKILKTNIAEQSGVLFNVKSYNIKKTVPQYCPKCCVEDLDIYGEIYWKRTHQIPSILVCPEHNCFLQTSSHDLQSISNRTRIFDATLETCDINKIVKNYNPTILLASQTMRRLLIGKRNKNEVFDTTHYRRILYPKYAKGKQFNCVSAIKDFNEYFGHETLMLYQGSQKWPVQPVFSIYNFHQRITNPLPHILMNLFIQSLDLSTFKKTQYDIKSVNCINPFAGHKREFKIKGVLSTSRKDKRPYLSFRCNCDTRWVMYYKSNGKLESPIIRHWGEKFINGLRPLIKSMSVDSISAKFCIPKGLIDGLIGRGLSSAKTRTQTKIEDINDKRERFRKIWLEAINKYQDLKIGQLAKLYPTVFKWLNTKDKSWYNRLNLKRKKRISTKTRYNYPELDNELSTKVKRIYTKLIRNNFKFRISKNILAIHINLPNSSYTTSQLPKTMELLNFYVENVQQYKKRLNKV